MLLTNLDYLKISIKNEEKTFDSSYMFLNKNLNIDNYVKVTQELKELLATIKTLKVRNQNTEQIYKDLFNIWKGEFAGQSEFNCFLSACDITRDKLFYNFEDFKIVVDLYLENRDLELYTPVHWIQALLDSISSKAKGKCGENKIINIAIEEGFKLVNSWEEFNKNKKAISSFSKNIFDIINIEKNLGVKLPNEKQNKLLDII